MNSVTVTLADRSYTLRRGTSVRWLKRRLVAAARRGAGFVRLPLASGPEVHALVNRSMPVTIEFRNTARVAAPSEWVPEPDLDLLDLERGPALVF
ncbi:hypothetical protein ACFOYW_04950 [Gryllotalpicola reticulitermitis]|uniref:Uncharacterized protein n=1 Tax=Gryllotalpicola reticulitermitis TaxID=1184153 RepID=A0ABV8Q5T1_9MICO